MSSSKYYGFHVSQIKWLRELYCNIQSKNVNREYDEKPRDSSPKVVKTANFYSSANKFHFIAFNDNKCSSLSLHVSCFSSDDTKKSSQKGLNAHVRIYLMVKEFSSRSHQRNFSSACSDIKEMRFLNSAICKNVITRKQTKQRQFRGDGRWWCVFKMLRHGSNHLSTLFLCLIMEGKNSPSPSFPDTLEKVYFSFSRIFLLRTHRKLKFSSIFELSSLCIRF